MSSFVPTPNSPTPRIDGIGAGDDSRGGDGSVEPGSPLLARSAPYHGGQGTHAHLNAASRAGRHDATPQQQASGLPGELPAVVSGDYTFRLLELVNSDFKMPPTDKDFELNQAQLIKVCKILLYKLNLNSKKNEYERGELTNMINERVGQIERLTKSSLEEVNTFLHQVHQDFESFLNKHKKEHSEVNIRQLKLTEDLSDLV